MRSSFSGFYGVNEETLGTVFTSDNTLFIFDANILLTLYRCEEETRNQFLSIWRNIREQCWFPHQVCLEYQRNRLKVIKGSRDSLEAISKKINATLVELRKEITGDNHNQTISRYTNLGDEIDELFSGFDRISSSFSDNSISLRTKNIDFFSKHDVIRDVIDELTVDRIGPAPSQQSEIESINKEGKVRYKYKTGPGYEDVSDKKNEFYSFGGINYDAEYGDLYVWRQILDFIKITPGKNIVYVTNDAKSDFFYKIDGKVRGPNESLVSEAKNSGANEFILQNLNTFLHHANNHLNADVNEDTISELTNASPILKRKKKLPSLGFLNSPKNLADKLQLAFLTNADLTKRRHEVAKNIADLTQELSYYHSAPVDEFNSAQSAMFENDYNEAMSKLRRLEQELAMINSIYHNASIGIEDSRPTGKDDDV